MPTNPNPSELREDLEQAAAHGFQAEGGEHATPAATPAVSEPAPGYEHADDELIWPID